MAAGAKPTDSASSRSSSSLSNASPGNALPSSSASISTGLLAGLRAQEAQQWRRMSSIYAPLVYQWCRKAGAGGDADDIVQEVFRTVVRRIGEFRIDRPGDTFRGWLYTITRHKLGDYFRRCATQPDVVGGSDFLQKLHAVPEEADVDSAINSEGLGGACHRALALIRVEFQDVTWQAFWRAVVDEQPAADIATALGISVNSVYLAKSRVLRRLREELGDVDAGHQVHGHQAQRSDGAA